MAKRNNHIHKYKRIDISRTGDEFLVFKCIKPDCSHYIGQHLALGLICECNRCGNVMVLDKAAIMLASPHCKECTKSRKTTQVADITKFLEEKQP